MTHVVVFALALVLAPAAPSDSFDAQAELQGLYDEISQATLQFGTASDVDDFHDVFYTPDWVFTDVGGHKQTWPDVRRAAVDALSVQRFDSMIQPITKLLVDPRGATVVVNVTTVQTVLDDVGRYGRPGASHTVTETTPYRDRWVRVSDEWKLKSREQIGKPIDVVDKPE